MSAPVITPKRRILPADFQLQRWEDIAPYFDELLHRPLPDLPAVIRWLEDGSELDSFLEEDAAWRYIAMSCDTADQAKRARFNDFVQEIQPKAAPVGHALEQRLLDSPFAAQLREMPQYSLMIRKLEASVEIFREQNIPIIAEVETRAQQYGAISGAMTVEVQGKELTMPQAAVLLEDPDRSLREEVYHRIKERRMADEEALDLLMDDLLAKRHQIAVNAGFANYRDYIFKAKGRFDYTPEDCFAFHEAIAAELVPLLDELALARKTEMGLDALRPWDLKVDPAGRPALRAFEHADDLVQKSTRAFRQMDPFFGDVLEDMHRLGRLDLASRKGKAPGGYNYPLYETGYPFIFMNATSTVRDLTTLMHEGGHAIHSVLTKDLSLAAFKNLTPEVAELASMSMELLSMDQWHLFFPDAEQLRRAQRDQLEDIIETLPWVATVDAFQHWLYEHPGHSREERRAAWLRLFEKFSDKVTDWTGLEAYKACLWQRQLHIFELPFYYVEYAIAQLGAVAVWKNYQQQPTKALDDYKAALALGYQYPIRQVYERAGIQFDFSKQYIRELIAFVQREWKKTA